MSEPLPTEIPTIDLRRSVDAIEAQVPAIEAQAMDLDKQIGDLMNEIYLMEEERDRLIRRIENRRLKVRGLARRRTTVLNFQLPLSMEENGS